MIFSDAACYNQRMSILSKARSQLMANWFVCRVTSGKRSAQYGIRFSYPVYISMVAVGVFFANQYLLCITAVIAFLGVVLPLHPFDYLYNHSIAKLFDTDQVAGRGSELQINSGVALLFNLSVITLIIYGVQVNYRVMSLIYTVSSALFIAVLLLKDDFSIHDFFPKITK